MVYHSSIALSMLDTPLSTRSLLVIRAQLKFHAVDLLLKIVEHDLDAEENRDQISEIFMYA